MTPSKLIISLICFCIIFDNVGSYNILFLNGVGSKSHKGTMTPLSDALAARNHTITVISGYKPSKDVPGVQEHVVPELAQIFSEIVPVDAFEAQPSVINLLSRFADGGRKACEILFNHPVILNAMNQIDKYDAVMVSHFITECFPAIIHKIGAPHIDVSPAGLMPPVAHNLRIPYPTSSAPFMLPCGDNMDFIERLINTVIYNVVVVMRSLLMVPSAHSVSEKYLGKDIPDFNTLERNISLVLLNNHISFDFPRPYMPNVIEVGGLHCKSGKPLPKVGRSNCFVCSGM